MNQRKYKDAMALLKEDHRMLKRLFDKFDTVKEPMEKIALVEDAVKELKQHAAIEEEMFYPALRQGLKETDVSGVLEEADEEHHVAKLLIAELDLMTGTESNYEAKFAVLAENVRHHIKEEEHDLFHKALKTDIDFAALGDRMLHRKKQLASDGVPSTAEDEMVKSIGLRGDSPAKLAAETFAAPRLADKQALRQGKSRAPRTREIIARR